MVPEVLRGLAGTGAERVLIHRWGGPLATELDAAADRHRHEPLSHLRVVLRRWRHTRGVAVWLEQAVAFAVLARYRPNLVWCNTSLSACYVRPAQRLRIPVVLHVHEMAELSRPVLARYGLAGAGPTGWVGVQLVACSDQAADDLAVTAGVPRDAVTVLTSAINVDAVAALGSAVAHRSADDALIIMACGTADLRKGVDRFRELAALMADAGDAQRLRWVWVGRADDLELAPRGGVVDFVGEVEDPVSVIAACDVFVVPARADPFPLAVLEAMALGKPIVAFAVGGIPEQLGDTGVLVPPGDVSSMASAIHDLIIDPAQRAQLGTQAFHRVLTHHDACTFHRLVQAIAGSLTP